MPLGLDDKEGEETNEKEEEHGEEDMEEPMDIVYLPPPPIIVDPSRASSLRFVSPSMDISGILLNFMKILGDT